MAVCVENQVGRTEERSDEVPANTCSGDVRIAGTAALRSLLPAYNRESMIDH